MPHTKTSIMKKILLVLSLFVLASPALADCQAPLAPIYPSSCERSENISRSTPPQSQECIAAEATYNTAYASYQIQVTKYNSCIASSTQETMDKQCLATAGGNATGYADSTTGTCHIICNKGYYKTQTGTCKAQTIQGNQKEIINAEIAAQSSSPAPVATTTSVAVPTVVQAITPAPAKNPLDILSTLRLKKPETTASATASATVAEKTPESAPQPSIIQKIVYFLFGWI